MWTIYKITNLINGKAYIGQTCQKVETRWAEHKRGKTSTNSPLKRAIEKYGWDNFSKEVIDTADTLEEALEKEIYWIEYYKTCVLVYGKEAGYNLSRGGEGVFYITPEQENLILELWNQHNSLTQIGKLLKIDRHTVQRALIRKGIDEEEFKVSQFYHYHPVYVYNLNGQLLDVFNTRNEACNAYSINTNQIQNVLSHKLASTHNLIFLYEEEIGELNNHIIRAHKMHKGKVQSTNLLTGEITIYNSIGEAQKNTGIDRHTIRNRIRNNIIKDNLILNNNCNRISFRSSRLLCQLLCCIQSRPYE